MSKYDDRNNVTWSSAPPTPWISPAEQAAGLTLGLGIPLGAAAGMTKIKVGTEGSTAFDLVQKTIRNVSAITPFGLANTFRIPELMTPFLSPQAQGLAKGRSILDGKDIFHYGIGANQASTVESRAALRGAVGSAYTKAGLDLADQFQLRYERTDASSRGKLFAREVGFLADKGSVGAKGEWKLLGENLMLTPTRGNADIFDIATNKLETHRTNPIYTGQLAQMGVVENIGETNIDKIWSEVDNQGKIVNRSRYGFVPSTIGGIGSTGELGRRATFLGGMLSFSMSRFPKLLEAASEQIPFLGKLGATTSNVLGLNFNTTPDKAHKMFARFGLGSAKVGGAYLALRTVDHIKRDYGFAGELAGSGAISLGAAALTRKVLKGKGVISAPMVGVASFFGQMILPGFDQGTVEGIATAGTKIHTASAFVGGITGMNFYRRTIDGFLPGFTDWQTGSLFGIAAMGLSASNYRNKMIEKELLAPSAGLRGRVGIVASALDQKTLPRNLGMNYFQEVVAMATGEGKLGKTLVKKYDNIKGDGFVLQNKAEKIPPWRIGRDKIDEILKGKDWSKATKLERIAVRRSIWDHALRSGQNPVDVANWMEDESYARHQRAIARTREQYTINNPLNDSHLRRVEQINRRYYGDFAANEAKRSLSPFTRLARRAEIFGSQFYHSLLGASLKGGPLLEKLEAANAKPNLGRWGTIFFGTLGVHQLLTGGLLGSLDTAEDLSDIYSGKKLIPVKAGRWWEAGGTSYGGGEETYYRPHAYHLFMTKAKDKAVWGEDLPSPIMQFFYKNFTYELERRTYEDRPYTMSSAAFQDVPIIGGILASTIGKLIKPPKLMHTDEYMRVGQNGEIEFAHKPEYKGPNMELGGKPLGVPTSPFSSSFVAGELQYKFREIEGMTGWAKNMIQKGTTGVETFGQMAPVFSNAGSMTSAIDRFWDLEVGGAFFLSEPLRRILPRPRSGIEEYNPIVNTMPNWMPDRFKWGDPYRNLPSGSARLPGAGYAALYPELKDVDPEAYPLIYKYSILSDVAPNSSKFSQVREQLYTRRTQGITTESENKYMDQIDYMRNKVMVKREFTHTHENAIELPGSGLTQAAYSGAQNLLRDVAAPVEYMIPMGFRPIQKLLPDRGMVEQYEYERMYGTPLAFWDKPWRDWFRPSLYSAAHMMGFDGKPGWREDADKISGYFDKMEFAKWMRLANSSDDPRARKEYLRKAQGTRYGVNPQGDAMSIYMSLPDSEKKFFDSFAYAIGDERKRILEMIPEDQTHLYEAIWKRLDNQDPSLYPNRNKDVNNDYLMYQNRNLGGMMETQMKPPKDWIGWHEDVDVDDIQLKYVDNLGKDMHEYDHWQKQARMLTRKPYLEGSAQFNGIGPHRAGIIHQLNRLSRGDSHSAPLEFYGHSTSGNYSPSHARMYYNDNREIDIHRAIDRWADFVGIGDN